MNNDLKDKTILITGATNGIGKAAAYNFASRGAKLVLFGRNKLKTEDMVRDLQVKSNNQNIEYIICDLSRMADIRRAADEFKTKHNRIDVLVNNAGAVFKTPFAGPDGIEMTFALNHLAYFQLTTSLLDLIMQTPDARIVSTSSSMQALGKLDLELTPKSLKGSGTLAYGTSKLANILFTKELQKRLEGTTAIANCFAPGSVKTSFGAMGNTDLGFLINLVYKIGGLFAITPEQGADSLVWLATSPEAANLKGEYVYKRKITHPQPQAMDSQLAKDLWKLSEKLCNEASSQ